MFINSQVGLPLPEKLANSAVLAAGVSQASGSASGFIQSTGAASCGLIGAAMSALSEGHLAGFKTSLVIAAIGGPGVANCGCVLRCIGGAATNATLQAVN
jgi:hypothetical protein